MPAVAPSPAAHPTATLHPTSPNPRIADSVRRFRLLEAEPVRQGLLRFGHETRKPKGVEDLALDGLPHALRDPLRPVNLLRIGVHLIQVDLRVLQLGRHRELQADRAANS